MAQAIQQVKLTSQTYHILEQMAQARSLTPSELVEDLVRQFQAQEKLASCGRSTSGSPTKHWRELSALWKKSVWMRYALK